MNYRYKDRDAGSKLFERIILSKKKSRNFYTTTPFMMSFCKTVITEFDINSFIELGLKIVRFKMSELAEAEQIKLLSRLEKAVKWSCEKYNVSTWPVTLTADIPNACIKTGLLENREDNPTGIFLKENSVLLMTCDLQYVDKCNAERIFIDDPLTMPYLVPGTEITINFGSVVMTSIKQIDNKNVICKVTSEGNIYNNTFVCVRGIVHTRPVLTDKDLEIIEYAKKLKFDIISINSVRNANTVLHVREMTKEYSPLVMSAICDQEGLDNIDSIIEASDGIILAEDFIFCQYSDKYKIITIHLYVSAKCRSKGKPLYISGQILRSALLTGVASRCDLSDITHAVLQRTGFVLRKFKDPANLVVALHALHDACQMVEPLCRYDNEFMRIAMEYKMPVNAAQATVIGAAFLAKVTQSLVIIVPTVTGKTVKQLIHMTADNIVIAITSNFIVAKQLQLLKGVITLTYDKKRKRVWEEEMEARLKFAVTSALKFNVLGLGSPYVVLRKSFPTSSYCDTVSSSAALTEEDAVRIEITRKSKLKSLFSDSLILMD